MPVRVSFTIVIDIVVVIFPLFGRCVDVSVDVVVVVLLVEKLFGRYRISYSFGIIKNANEFKCIIIPLLLCVVLRLFD